MTPIEPREFLTWIAIIAIIALAATTGMLINRFLIHRAHRRALNELRRRILEEAAPFADTAFFISRENTGRY